MPRRRLDSGKHKRKRHNANRWIIYYGQVSGCWFQVYSLNNTPIVAYVLIGIDIIADIVKTD